MIFTAIDRHTGYVWGVADADSVEQAGIMIMNDADAEEYEIVEHLEHHDTTDRGLAMYAMPGDWVDWKNADGQDPKYISHIETVGRFVEVLDVQRLEG